MGLHDHKGAVCLPLFGVGEVVLFTYRVSGSSPKWNFGCLLGVNVKFFSMVDGRILSVVSGALKNILARLVLSQWPPFYAEAIPIACLGLAVNSLSTLLLSAVTIMGTAQGTDTAMVTGIRIMTIMLSAPSPPFR